MYNIIPAEPNIIVFYSCNLFFFIWCGFPCKWTNISKLQYKKVSHFAIIWNLIYINVNSLKEENKSDDTLWTSRLHPFRKKSFINFKIRHIHYYAFCDKTDSL